MNKDLKESPHTIANRTDVWWYEEPNGIVVVVEPGEKTKTIAIPWKSIRNDSQPQARQRRARHAGHVR